MFCDCEMLPVEVFVKEGTRGVMVRPASAMGGARDPLIDD
jgi:hypothetical protein